MNPCIYCGTEWPYPNEIVHAADCPSITGLYPVLDRDLGQKVECVECGHVNRWPPGFCCTGCGAEFQVGDFYCHRPMPGAEVPGLSVSEFVAIVCMSCAASDVGVAG